MKVTVTLRSVVTKATANRVEKFVLDGFHNVHISWTDEMARNHFCEVIDEELGNLHQQGKIVTGKVVCDDRNNKVSDFRSGKFRLDVVYREKNALVETKLEFAIDING